MLLVESKRKCNKKHLLDFLAKETFFLIWLVERKQMIFFFCQVFQVSVSSKGG